MPHLPRSTRVALLAGCATLGLAATASADQTGTIDGAGKLTITFDAGDDFTVGAQAGNVLLGADPLPIPTGDVKTIEVLEVASGNSNADLSAVNSATYPNLISTHIKAIDGNDTLTGTQLTDRIEGGTGADTMHGLGGDDTLVWNNGEGSDIMNGGDGIDTIENNGADTASPVANEVYTVDIVNGRFIFARTSGGPFTLDVGGAERYVNNMLGGNDSFKTVDQARAVAGIAVTLNGGEGNDNLTGTDGGDTISGGPGDDTITGFKGNDTSNGDDGNDLIVWNNGDGSDRVEGGAGADTAQLNGGGAGEHFVLTGNAARVTATRDTQVPFFLDIGTSELFDLNGNAGDDSVDVGNGVGAVLASDLELGDGNDTIRARNDSSQRIDGGAGADSAQVDATDVVSNVETIDAPAVAQPGGDTPDTVAPKVAFVSKKLRVKGGKARLKITCPAGESACTGKARILRGKKVVGSIAVKLAGGQTKTFKIALKRKTRVALSKERDNKLRVLVKISVKDAAGNTGKVSRQLNLKG